MTINEDTFYKVTNRDIYCKLCDLETHIKLTNGKVKLNKWISTTALTVALTMAFYIISSAI